MKDRTDFELDQSPPRTIKDIIVEEIAYAERDGKSNNPLLIQSMDELMQVVFARIEQQALQIYKSNEIWALRRWCLENILKDEIVNEAACKIADGIVNPIIDWQHDQNFDPIQHYRRRLTSTLRLSEGTIRVYMQTAAKFIAMIGRKNSYSDDDVLRYLDWAGEHFKKNSSSYVCECQRLLQFLRNLPSADRKRELPIPMPKMPETFNQPTLSDDEVETLAWSCVLDKVKPNMIIRIIVASIYGGRKSELAELSSSDFHLDGEKSSIYIATKKGGDKRRQPIPQSLVPLFAIDIKPMNPVTLHFRLRKIAEKAPIVWKRGSGFHSFRRNVVTMLDSLDVSDMAQYKFLRWSTPRHLGMLDRYRQIPSEESDAKILSVHPRVKLWEEILPYMLEFNPYYRKLCDIDIYTYL